MKEQCSSPASLLFTNLCAPNNTEECMWEQLRYPHVICTIISDEIGVAFIMRLQNAELGNVWILKSCRCGWHRSIKWVAMGTWGFFLSFGTSITCINNSTMVEINRDRHKAHCLFSIPILLYQMNQGCHCRVVLTWCPTPPPSQTLPVSGCRLDILKPH